MELETLRDAHGATDLERLQFALGRLEGGDVYVFMDWRHCTCGHIFRAALGRHANGTLEPFTNRDERYVRLLNLVIDAHPEHQIRRTTDETGVVGIVSELTACLTRGGKATRDAAIEMLRTTIAHVEAQYEQNRIDVLAQTREVIDGVREEVMA